MILKKMPVLRPIPIKTKNEPFYIGIFRWMFKTRKWKVEENWYYTLRLPGEKEKTIMIPKGFTFDGASIPRLFWAILSPVGLLLIPGLIHDYAYKYNELICIDNGNQTPYMKGAGRIKWDNLFRKIVIDVNGFTFINSVAWLFLILFGWFAWNKHRKMDKHNKRLSKSSFRFLFYKKTELKPKIGKSTPAALRD